MKPSNDTSSRQGDAGPLRRLRRRHRAQRCPIDLGALADALAEEPGEPSPRLRPIWPALAIAAVLAAGAAGVAWNAVEPDAPFPEGVARMPSPPAPQESRGAVRTLEFPAPHPDESTAQTPEPDETSPPRRRPVLPGLLAMSPPPSSAAGLSPARAPPSPRFSTIASFTHTANPPAMRTLP